MGYDGERFPLLFNVRLFEILALSGFGKIGYDFSKIVSASPLPEMLIKAYDVDVKDKPRRAHVERLVK